jgi:hypothetical protein
MSMHFALKIITNPNLQGSNINLMHAAGSSKIESMCGSSPHSNARSHDPNAGQCGVVGIYTSTGSDYVVS